MKGVRRLIVILFLLLVMAALTYSQAPVKLNGSEGMALLSSLTNSQSPLNLNNSSLNVTNSSANLIVAHNGPNDDFWSWGTRPKDPPGPQSEIDYLNDSAV